MVRRRSTTFFCHAEGAYQHVELSGGSERAAVFAAAARDESCRHRMRRLVAAVCGKSPHDVRPSAGAAATRLNGSEVATSTA
jgi:hypothetical protein